MGQLIVTEFVTLDGVAQAPGRPDEDHEDEGGEADDPDVQPRVELALADAHADRRPSGD